MHSRLRFRSVHLRWCNCQLTVSYQRCIKDSILIMCFPVMSMLSMFFSSGNVHLDIILHQTWSTAYCKDLWIVQEMNYGQKLSPFLVKVLNFWLKMVHRAALSCCFKVNWPIRPAVSVLRSGLVTLLRTRPGVWGDRPLSNFIPILGYRAKFGSSIIYVNGLSVYSEHKRFAPTGASSPWARSFDP